MEQETKGERKMNSDIDEMKDFDYVQECLLEEDLKEKQEAGIELTADLSKGTGEIKITKERQKLNKTEEEMLNVLLDESDEDLEEK